MWAEHGFYQVDITYSSGGNSNNYTFRNTDNTSTTFDLGSHSSPFVIQTMKLYCWDNWGDKSYTNNSGQFIYSINNGSANYFGSGSLTKSSYSGNNFQLYKNDCNLTLAAASGKYTFNLKWQAWGWGDNSDCYVDNNGKGYTWKYTILPPAVSSIGISASGHLAGSGTQADPYVLVYGESLKLTASVNNSDANSNTHFTFGSNAASTTKTHTISNITDATAQKITIKAQNINKSDNSLKGTALSKDIYYKYTPVYVYIDGRSHQINNTTKQVTVALNRNANDETYTFKVHDNNNHRLGNSGTMERGGASVHSGGWTMSVDDKNDCKLKADLTGDYTFTFMPATNKVTVTYPQKSYFIAGSWDNWAGTAPSFVDASTPVSIYLEADQTYSFKVADLTANAKWYGNDGTMTRANSTAWEMSTNKGNCQITTDLAGNYDFTFDQSTKKLTVTYPTKVTLGYCDFGQYGIEYDGTTYYSKPDENVEINIPLGASVRVLEGTPLNNAYTGDVIKAEPTKEELTTGQTLTINGDITLDDNFKTKEPHVVYLGVPETLDNWQLENNQTYYIWKYDSKGSISMTAADEGSYVFTKDGIKYYRFTIAAGCNSYRFERKNKDSFTGTTLACSEWLDFQIPLTNVNCFTLKNEKEDENRYKGDWSVLPAQAGDYRLLYVEQTVEYGEIIFDKSHPSDIVKLTSTGEEAIVSLHLYNKRAGGVNGTNNAAVILQRCTGYDAGVAQWEEVEYHMVYNYLFSDASAALLPGRRNTVELQVHDGLEVIKAVADSEEHDYGSGVWNFTVKKTEGSATLLLDEEHLKPYEGNYYIRTDNAEGGWSQYTLPGNIMTFSSYAKANSGYSHYYCKYVDIADDPKNVKFVIANDHGTAISDTLDGDDFVPKENNGSIYKGELQESANIRWQWNMVTNEVKRAYVKGSSDNNFLTVTQESGTTTKFNDNGNWIYEADIEAAVGDKITAITARYREKNQSLLEPTYQTGGMPLLTGDPSGTHDIHVMYDFKINKTMALLVPGTGVNTTIDVLIERTNQGDAQQVSNAIKAADTENGYTVYAVMSFTQNHIEGSGTQSEKLYYWVSFPFDVRISDVFGFGEYGVHWIMEYYDGAERAKNGAWIDSPTYWRYITDTTSVQGRANTESLNCGILKANQGYVLALALNIANMGIFTNTDKVSLYFPSMSPITTQIDGNIIETTVTLDEYECTIERDNRKIHDSNWHIIGVPSFSDKQQTLTQDNLLYFYTRDQKNDTYIATSAKDEKVTFKSLHSYMVQYAGTINWATTWTLSQPQGLAAKRNAETEKTHSLRLELSQNGTYNDQTLVTLQEEGATEAFDMNLDLSKMMNAGNNIYTLAGDELIQVAGNSLPIANTVIPVGVQIAKAGEYTFAMPDGTDGIVVELIDYVTNIRTNLMLDEYTVDLAAGTNEARFALHVKPNKVTTSLEDGEITTTNGKVRKFLIDGVLYLYKDGVLYDAQGRCVQ